MRKIKYFISSAASSTSARPLTMIIIFIVLSLLITSNNSIIIHITKKAFAMGAPPGSCENEYDYTLKSFKIQSGGRIYDPLATSGLKIDADTSYGYIVRYVIHANETNQAGTNSNVGSIWLDYNAYGFYNGLCESGIYADQDTARTVYISGDSARDGQVSNVEWQFGENGPILTYTVSWHQG